MYVRFIIIFKEWIDSKTYISSITQHKLQSGYAIPGGPEITEQSIQSIFQNFALINS